LALLSDIKKDLKQAMLDKNDLERDTIRMFLAEVQRFEIDNQEEADDSKALQIVNKMIKQRNDSITQFKSGGRDDLADKEQKEVDILSKYKPAQLSEEEVTQKVKEAIELMDLSDKIDEPVKRLSGGQQRRVAIARTIAQGPKLILADEFLSELDDKTVEDVWKAMLDYVESNNITLVIVEHNLERARLAKRWFKLEKDKDNSYSILSEVGA